MFSHIFPLKMPLKYCLILAIFPALLLLHFSPLNEACSCQFPAFNETMCWAHWVSHVVVLNNQTRSSDGLNLNYTVKHLEVFKNPNGTNLAGKNGNLLSSAFSSACGVDDLQLEEEYLLAGTIDTSGAFRINICLRVPLEDGPSGGDNVEKHLAQGLHPKSWDAVGDGLKKRLLEWEQNDGAANCTEIE